MKAALQSQSGQPALFQAVFTVTASDMSIGLSKAEKIAKKLLLQLPLSVLPVTLAGACVVLDVHFKRHHNLCFGVLVSPEEMQ